MFTKEWVVDTVERVVATFVEAFVATWVLAGPADLFSLDAAKQAAVAGVVAALSLVKSVIATWKSNTISPASLAPPPSTPAA